MSDSDVEVESDVIGRTSEAHANATTPTPIGELVYGGIGPIIIDQVNTSAAPSTDSESRVSGEGQ
jgi:hypothetical protein